MNRQQLEKMYEEKTGLSAQRGSGRIDIIERVIKEQGVTKFDLIDDPDEINWGWQEGRRWSAGAQIDNKICLGYTNRGTKRNNCRNAIFMVIK